MSKTSINDLFLAFQQFQNQSLRAINHNHSVIDYQEKFKQAQDELKAKLQELGIAQHIDFSAFDEK